jgi:regulator of extracellular matrix RemA (YlzA/DUF370 family)
VFLHVGGDVVVSLSRVIAILDLRSATVAQATRDFLALSRQERTVLDITLDGKPKSVIITDDEIYLSPISSHTLKRRGEEFIADRLADNEDIAE